MKIIQKPNVENDIVSVDITVQMLGTADLTAEQEKELISNYNKVIEYNKIQFKGNIKINSDGVPEVTEDSVDGTNVVELEIKDIINERKIVNEDISFHFERDVTKYPDSVLNNVLNKKELYAQAECVLFATRIKEALEEKLAEILASGGEGIVLKKKCLPYYPDLRPAWSTIKVKQIRYGFICKLTTSSSSRCC